MAEKSESLPAAPLASVGLLVTLPAEWAAELKTEVRCPRCNSICVARGAGGFNALAVWINHHVTECPNREATR